VADRLAELVRLAGDGKDARDVDVVVALQVVIEAVVGGVEATAARGGQSHGGEASYDGSIVTGLEVVCEAREVVQLEVLVEDILVLDAYEEEPGQLVGGWTSSRWFMVVSQRVWDVNQAVRKVRVNVVQSRVRATRSWREVGWVMVVH